MEVTIQNIENLISLTKESKIVWSTYEDIICINCTYNQENIILCKYVDRASLTTITLTLTNDWGIVISEHDFIESNEGQKLTMFNLLSEFYDYAFPKARLIA